MLLGLFFLSLFLLFVCYETLGWVAFLIPFIIVAIMIWTDPNKKKKNDQDIKE